MNNIYLRSTLFFFILFGIFFIPLNIPKTKLHQISTKETVVNVSLIELPKEKKKVAKKVKKKKPIKKKKLTKKKLKKKPIPKPKPKKKLKPKPTPKPVPKKTVLPLPPKKKELVEKKEEPIKEEILKEEKLKEIDKQLQEEQEQKRLQKQEVQKSYYDKIYQIIAQNKRYPLRARRFKKEGSIPVHFLILLDGSIKNLELIKPSRHKILNRAVEKLFEELESFPKPPSELSFPLEISITINYKLKR